MSDQKLRALQRSAEGGDAESVMTFLLEQERQGVLGWESGSALVRQFPDHDAPREVLARALVAAGNPRGEFIEAQLALAAGPLPADRPRHRQTVKRLLGAHEEEWLAPLGLSGSWLWKRGFLHTIEVEAASFLATGGVAFEHEPIRRVTLLSCSPGAIAPLSQATWLGNLEALKLSGWIGDEGARLVANTPGLAGLRSLNLSGCGVGAAGGKALGESPNLDALQTLSLSGNELGDPGLAALLANQQRSYRALYLSRCELSNASLASIANAPACHGLERLALGGNPGVNEEGLRALLGSPVVHSLRFLELNSWIDLSPEVDQALRTRIRNVRI